MPFMVVLEGIDKAGKSTQANLLRDALTSMGYRCNIMSFPDYSTHIGREIYGFLHGDRDYPLQVKHMLLSANRWEKKDIIEQVLRESDYLIMNRYYQSNLVYGYIHNLELDWLENLDRGLPKEDLVIVIDVSVNEAMRRMEEREEESNSRSRYARDRFEDVDTLSKASLAYRVLAERYGWIVVDGNRSRECVHKDILDTVIKKSGYTE